jgi:Tol biopolymer transport system component
MDTRNQVRPSWRWVVVAASLWAVALPLAMDVDGMAAQVQPRGPYFGQTPPGTKPEVFAPGIVSTAAHEFACSFTPDGKEFYFTRRAPSEIPTRIMVSRLVNDAWTTPAPAPFNAAEGQMSFEPQVTPDGRRLYFQSDRPLPDQIGQSGMPALNIWYVERQGDRWDAPRPAGSPFNPMRSMYITMTKTGTIYTTDISGGMGTERIGVARLVNGNYKKLEALGAPVNVGVGNMYPYIAPDESYLVFTRRLGQPGDTVLFVSFRNADGTWSEPRSIDLGMRAGSATVSPDGRYLFFSGGDRTKGDIYWVSASVLGVPATRP